MHLLFHSNIIFNIGGIEWKKVRGKKITSKIEISLKRFMEKICIRNSDSVIIDNIFFKKYIEDTYQSESILCEYGGDHAEKVEPNSKLISEFPFLDYDYDLSISRAQKDMNIDLIIEAYKKLDRIVVIISNWEISEYGRNLYKKYSNEYNNIILLNSIFDLDILNCLRSNCKIYIHSHSLCGTAPSLVEAMALGLAVICFDVPTNRNTTENKSSYFSD